jgi:hypothetical protein
MAGSIMVLPFFSHTSKSCLIENSEPENLESKGYFYTIKNTETLTETASFHN